MLEEKNFGKILKRMKIHKLEEIKKNFISEFEMTGDDYENEVIEFGDTLENFYIHIRKTFETRLKPLKRRGRPRKLNL